jgi:hypothetical protein
MKLPAMPPDREFLEMMRHAIRDANDTIARSRLIMRETATLLALADALAQPLITDVPPMPRTNRDVTGPTESPPRQFSV